MRSGRDVAATTDTPRLGDATGGGCWIGGDTGTLEVAQGGRPRSPILSRKRGVRGNTCVSETQRGSLNRGGALPPRTGRRRRRARTGAG